MEASPRVIYGRSRVARPSVRVPLVEAGARSGLCAEFGRGVLAAPCHRIGIFAPARGAPVPRLPLPGAPSCSRTF